MASSCSRWANPLVVISFLLSLLVTSAAKQGTGAAEGHDDNVWEAFEREFEVRMEEGGRLSGRLSTNKNGKLIGLVFSAGGAGGHSPSLRTLEGKVLITPLGRLHSFKCRTLQVAQSTFVDCPRKGSRYFRAIGRPTSASSDAFIHTQENSDTLFHAAVHEVLQMPEVHLLPTMSRELARYGFHGNTSSAILQLHITAQRFSDLLQGRSGLDVTMASTLSKRSMKKCAHDKACPPCKDTECTGMCGPKCSCWKWVCGDCCYHQGCLDHDICCAKGPFSWRCLLPFGLECSKKYVC